MGVLSHLEPREVFYYFEEICKVPHPSYHEKMLSDYCVRFGKEHQLEVYQDEHNNVILIKEATKGYEEVETVVLQGHLDMVAQKTADCSIDFLTDPLELEVVGDYVRAKGTTLGGDDGIAVAYGLALLASDTIPHPRLEVIFTTGEEVGLLGASAIDVSMCKGRRMINLDSEDEGIFLSGCAGGATASVCMPLERMKKQGTAFGINVTGLQGGHSGMEIHKGRENANIYMVKVLEYLEKECDFSVLSLQGGDKDNAIPREGEAQVVTTEPECFRQKFEDVKKIMEKEYQQQEPDAKLSLLQKEEGEYSCLSESDWKYVKEYFAQMPNGVQAMSKDVEGLVETSLNLGILYMDEGGMHTSYSVRSSIDQEKETLMDHMRCISKQWNAKMDVCGNYPGWQYQPESRLRQDMKRIFMDMYGKEPVIEAIHAGVECGLFAQKMPGLDCVSIGPDMDDIHTTEEQLSISSVKRVWEFLLEVLKLK